MRLPCGFTEQRLPEVSGDHLFTLGAVDGTAGLLIMVVRSLGRCGVVCKRGDAPLRAPGHQHFVCLLSCSVAFCFRFYAGRYRCMFFEWCSGVLQSMGSQQPRQD